MHHLANQATSLRIFGMDRGEFSRVRGAAILAVLGGSIAGCGSDNSPSTPATSMATLTISSDANDRFTSLGMTLQDITLTDAAGNTVSLTTASQKLGAEFIHVNGKREPLLTVSIPQGVYTSASITVDSAGYECVNYDNGLQYFDLGPGGPLPQSDVKVTLPAQLIVDTGSIGLTLKLLVSPSVETVYCVVSASGIVPSIMMTPTFTLSSFAIDSPQDTALTGLDGEIKQPDAGGGSFQLALVNGVTLNVTTDGTTAWQGITGLPALQSGQFADLDGALQANGSVRATRISVMDPAAVSVESGPATSIEQGPPARIQHVQNMLQGDGTLFIGASYIGLDAGTRFGISGQLSNLQTLPFTPDFSAASMVAGQNLYVSTPAFVNSNQYDALANTITLLPQTVDATVTGADTTGSFTIYTVSLASYDLFAKLAMQAGSNVVLSDPSVMLVYADSSTQMLSTSPPSPGDTLRFYGLVFNDGGTLRMDCARILDGVEL